MADEPEGLDVGLHPGIDESDYHADLAVSQSQLKVLRYGTPRHLRHQILHPKDPTPAMELGSAVHSSILTPDLFDSGYVRALEGDGRKKEVKEARARQAAEFPGCVPMKPEDYDRCLAMRHEVLAHKDASVLLDCQRKELTAVWEDEATNLLCRARMDAVSDDGTIIVDVKTTRDASREAFSRAIYQFGYEVQAACSVDGAVANGLPATLFAIIAVEVDPPHCVCVFQISGEAIDAGRQELRRLMQIYSDCVDRDEWPSYRSPVEITLPAYAWRQIEERTSQEEGV